MKNKNKINLLILLLSLTVANCSTRRRPVQNSGVNSSPVQNQNLSVFVVKGKIVSVSTTDGLVGWVCEKTNQQTVPGLEIFLGSDRFTIQVFREPESLNAEAISQCSGVGAPYRFSIPYVFLKDYPGQSISVYAVPSFSSGSRVTLTDSGVYRIPFPPTGPTCTFSVARQNSTSTCNITITSSGAGTNFNQAPQVNNQVPAPGGTWVIDPNVNGAWSGSAWTGTAPCAIDKVTAFSAYLKLTSGELGQPCGGAPIMVAPATNSAVIPTCTFQVSRQGSTSTCNVMVTTSGAGTNFGRPPQVNKQDPFPGGNWIVEYSAQGAWSGNTWSGTASCPVERGMAFSAYVLPLNGGLSPACGAPIIINGL
jgi:hypothetical protein